MRKVHDHWLTAYDWRACEARINGFGSYATGIDGLRIHFLHIPSKHKNAKPLVLTHGWPGSILEFYKAIPRLTDPTAHGGSEADAFHVVVPSLPGYGFSEKPNARGWNVLHIAQAWAELMRRLGYDKYLAQGGDWGAPVSLTLGRTDPDHCKAIHINLVIARPSEEQLKNLTPTEAAAWAGIKEHQNTGTGYSKQQSTRPQTLGYGLVDSPIAQAAWIIEKYWAWCDCNGDPLNSLTLDEMLDNVMMYWLTGTGGSSGRLYWESFAPTAGQDFTNPIGASIFPGEIMKPSRRWAENRLKNIYYWNEAPKGGHFAAFEVPDIFVDELRACFGKISI
jgi:pimeloyl-ACP methyl ester carboxylesterase